MYNLKADCFAIFTKTDTDHRKDFYVDIVLLFPLPGTTKVNRLTENLGAVQVTLTLSDLKAIEVASEKIKIQGARLPETLLAITGL